VGSETVLTSFYRVHRVLEKSLKVLEFWREKNSRPLKVLENRVGP